MSDPIGDLSDDEIQNRLQNRGFDSFTAARLAATRDEPHVTEYLIRSLGLDEDAGQDSESC